VTAVEFYDQSRIAIIPMGYCYPGRGRGRRFTPRPECARLWLQQLLTRLPLIQLTLLIGQYAQRHFLGERRKESLAKTTSAWAEYYPTYIPLPHPSPRNTPWLKTKTPSSKSTYFPSYAGEFSRCLLASSRSSASGLPSVGT